MPRARSRADGHHRCRRTSAIIRIIAEPLGSVPRAHHRSEEAIGVSSQELGRRPPSVLSPSRHRGWTRRRIPLVATTCRSERFTWSTGSARRSTWPASSRWSWAPGGSVHDRDRPIRSRRRYGAPTSRPRGRGASCRQRLRPGSRASARMNAGSVRRTRLESIDMADQDHRGEPPRAASGPAPGPEPRRSCSTRPRRSSAARASTRPPSRRWPSWPSSRSARSTRSSRTRKTSTSACSCDAATSTCPRCARWWPPADDPTDQLHRLVDFEVGFFRQHRHFGRLILRSSPRSLPATAETGLEKAVAGNFDEAMDLQADLFVRGQAAGRFRQGDPQVLARLFSGLIAAFQSQDPAVISDRPAADRGSRSPTCTGSSRRAFCPPVGSVSDQVRTAAPGITDEGVERLRARIGIPEPHPMPPHYSCRTSTPSATSRSPTATTTRCGAIPTTAPKTRWERPDRVAGARRRRHADRRGRGHRGRGRARAS